MEHRKSQSRCDLGRALCARDVPYNKRKDTEDTEMKKKGSRMEDFGNEILTAVARIHTEYKEKFGIPRQSGLVPSSRGEIHLEGRYRSWDAVRGIGEFSHLWLLWGFSANKKRKEHLTAAPPRLGGRERRGVFATRSPYRPNGIGLSCVRLEEVRTGTEGEPVLVVSGADLLDGTPIYDIKPYLPYTDAHPEAEGGFGEAHKSDRIQVVFPEELQNILPTNLQTMAVEVLAQDPRAAYQKKPEAMYGLRLGDYDLRFMIHEDRLYVKEVSYVQTPGWHRIKEKETRKAGSAMEVQRAEEGQKDPGSLGEAAVTRAADRNRTEEKYASGSSERERDQKPADICRYKGLLSGTEAVRHTEESEAGDGEARGTQDER